MKKYKGQRILGVMSEISVSERIKFYIGKAWTNQEPPNIHFSLFDNPFKIDEQSPSRFHYDEDIVRYYQLSENKTLWFCCGDQPYVGRNYPVLVKTRDTFNKQSTGIIANLNKKRHWTMHSSSDIIWEDKKSNVFWRGADTGHNMHFNERINFVEKYFNVYDVAFSDYSQNIKTHSPLYKKEWLKGFSGVSEFLEYKYLPVIDGNDKSSSLNWILASNSVPIMPSPRYHSWLCEHLLQPYTHYVPVKRDFSNLGKVLDWCLNNDSKCKEIAKNGKNFMMNFSDQDQESYIEKEIINRIEEFQKNNNWAEVTKKGKITGVTGQDDIFPAYEQTR